jgi:hypothetical protein
MRFQLFIIFSFIVVCYALSNVISIRVDLGTGYKKGTKLKN